MMMANGVGPMSFQAYLDTIREKTGKGPDDFIELAAGKGLLGPAVKAGEVISWLDRDFGLGRGHAMAIFAILKAQTKPRASASDRVDKLFSGKKAVWRATFDALCAAANAFGDDVGISPTDSYLSLVRNDKKFAIVQVAANHLDVGIKRKGAAPTERFTAAGRWNAMVTHRVGLGPGAVLDDELIGWLKAAYDGAH